MVKRRISFKWVLSSLHRIVAFRYFLVVGAISISLTSCYNEPEFLGGNIVPSSDRLSVKTDTSFLVTAHTVSTDTIPTGSYNNAVLGCYNSIFTGKTKADFVTQIFIYDPYLKDTVLTKMTARPVPDSVCLLLELSKVWGTVNKPINVKVFEISDSLIYDKYYNGMTSMNGKYEPTQISYPVTYSGDSMLRIKLTSTFAQKLMNAPDTAFTTNSEFIKILKGIYITSDDYSGSDGVLYSFKNLRMNVYYDSREKGVKHDTIFSYYRGVYSARFNHFEHNYSTARADLKINHLNDTTFQDSVFYVSGLGGTRGLIKLRDASEWMKKMPVAINRAELQFSIQNHTEILKDSVIFPLMYYSYRDTDTSFNSKGYTSLVNDLNYYSLSDYEITKNQTVSFNKARNYYSIDITIHLQNVLKGKFKKNFFYLEPTDFKVNYREGIYRSGKNSNPMKLIITYSKL